MPSGHNGPWDDEETSVRNTSHWLITFLKAYEINESEKFRKAARKAVHYLESEEVRPNLYTFHHRLDSDKNKCNGLIGQAWTIEALVYADKVLNDMDLDELAQEVFLLHPFNEQFGIWKRREINGDILFYDMTLNHQLWFAAAGSMLENEEIRRQVEVFLDNLESNLGLYEEGLIIHHVSRTLHLRDFLNSFRSTDNFKLFFGRLKHILSDLKSRNSSKAISRDKAIGYHSFNTYALAILRKNFPDHDFWKSKKFEKVLEYTVSSDYKSEIESNKYGWPYNPPGIENAYTLHILRKDIDEEKEWMKKQLSKTFDFEENLMNNDELVIDGDTYAARFYEATRLPNYNLEEDEF